MASQYRIQINDWLRNQSFKADKVLDVGGCEGPIQKLTTIEANRIQTLDFNGDLKPSFVHDLNIFAHPDDLFGSERNPRFDLIFCMNVFEYIHNPYNAVANLYSWLGQGGTLVVNFPFLYPVHNPVGIDYLRYTHEWVEMMLHDRFKFKDVDITILQATTGARDLMNFYSNEKMHYRKHDESWREIGCIVKAVK